MDKKAKDFIGSIWRTQKMTTEIAIIPDFTAEQYYNSSEPYEWLYKYKNDKFLMKQLM